MKKYAKDLTGAFAIKVLALIVLGIFFSYYKDWYPKPVVERDTIYQPLKAILDADTVAIPKSF